MLMTKLSIMILVLIFALAVPALAQDPGSAPTGVADQYGGLADIEETGDAVTVEGTVREAGITSYQYGTHVLLGESGNLLFALRSETVTLDDYVGQRVTVHGARVSGYQNGAVEGGPDLLDVTRVDNGSATHPGDQSDTDTSGADSSGTGDSTPSHQDTGDAAAAVSVLPDTGGIPVSSLLAINAALISGAVLARRIVG